MSLKRKLASQSAVIFGMRVFGAGMGFVGQAAIARFLGSPVLGEYLLFAATINLIAVVMPLGFHTVGTYFAAEYQARQQRGLLWYFVRRAYMHVAVSAFVVFVLGAFVADRLGVPGQTLAAHWVPAAILGIATALEYVNGALLVGMKHPLAGFFADALLRPMLLVGGFLTALLVGAGGGAGLSVLLWVFSVGFMAVSLGHMAMTFFFLSRVDDVPRPEDNPAAEAKRWWRFSVPWVVTGLATDFFFDLDLLFLSGLLTHSELAVFGVSARIFSLVSFGVAAVYAVTLPHMFEDRARSDTGAFAQKVGDANVTAALLAGGFFVLVGLTGPFLLLLFGPAFLIGSGPLAVLCLGLVVRSIFGPVALALSMEDRPYASLPAVGLGIAVLFATNWLLVPHFGLMGAAIAALLSIAMWSGAMWWTARRVANIDVSIFPRLSQSRWFKPKPSRAT